MLNQIFFVVTGISIQYMRHSPTYFGITLRPIFLITSAMTFMLGIKYFNVLFELIKKKLVVK